MFNLKFHFNHLLRMKICLRRCCLTTTEVSAALRPFYFEVHPDLFGKYPIQRSTNEDSLKQLSAIIETLQANKSIQPATLHFYIRNKSNNYKQDNDDDENGFRSIKINIRERNIRDIVLTILKSCKLSTAYVDKIPKTVESNQSKIYYPYTVDINNKNVNRNNNDPIFQAIQIKRKIRETKEDLRLKQWLEKNYKQALEKSKANEPVLDDLIKLRQQICNEWNLNDVRWDCGWNVTHFRGCLLSFMSLAEHHQDAMCALSGRTIVFAPFTGISLDGHIMLNSGEVRHNWLDLLKNVRKYDAVLFRIPGFEKSVSQVLRGIKVGRRKFMPKILAGEYERNLQQITTSLSDYQGRYGYPKEWPHSLTDYEIVVETEAGPLMVSPTGQFIVPSSLPGLLLVNFITKNLKEAKEKMDTYQKDKYIEQTLHTLCKNTLKLAALRKDDNVTPDLMIKCCNRLLEKQHELEQYLKDIHLNVSTYYSVLSDGVVCIPWNWDLN